MRPSRARTQHSTCACLPMSATLWAQRSLGRQALMGSQVPAGIAYEGFPKPLESTHLPSSLEMNTYPFPLEGPSLAPKKTQYVLAMPIHTEVRVTSGLTLTGHLWWAEQWFPKDAHGGIPRICAYGTRMAERTVGMRLKGLEMGDSFSRACLTQVMKSS